MNAFEDDQPSLTGEYVSSGDRERCCSLKAQRRFRNLFWFLFGICLSGVFVFFYGNVIGFSSSNAPVQTYPGPIPITLSEPISGSSCLIKWEKTFFSNNYKLLIFELALSDDAQKNWEPLQLANSGFDFTRKIEGLSSSYTYKFRLRGCAEVGCGNFTYTHCRTEDPSVPETPRAPIISSVRQNVDMAYFSINVTSADNGGAAITQVELRHTDTTSYSLSNSSLGCSFGNNCVHGCNCTLSIRMPYLDSKSFSFSTQVSNHVGKSGWSVPTECIIFTNPNRNPMCVLTSPPAAPVGLSWKTEVSNLSIQWETAISVNSATPSFFEVWLSDPWNNREEVIRIINVTDNIYQNNTLLPDTVYEFAVRAYDNIGRPGNMSKYLVFGTSIRGNCGNHQDVNVLKAQFDKASKYSYICWEGSCQSSVTPEGQDCTEECINSMLGFTTICSKCWFERTVCLADACSCKTNPEDCQRCYNNLCLDSFLNCTGLPAYASPPAKLDWTQSKVDTERIY